MARKIPLVIIGLIALVTFGALMSYVFSSCSVRVGADADSFFEHKLIGENAYQLSDGTNVSLWEGFAGKYHYKLENGTALLDFYDRNHRAHAGGYNNLSDAAKLKVDEYYENQAPLYSIAHALDAAYEDYLKAGEEFETHPLQREVYNSGENDYYLCQITEFITPAAEHYENEIDVKHLSVIFDKATGEVVSPWSLFSIPEDEAKELMINAMGDMYDKQQLLSHIDKAQIHWYGDHMQIEFLAGSVPGMTMSHSAGISGESLIPYLTEKAMPKLTQ